MNDLKEVGNFSFSLEVLPPDINKIPEKDRIGASLIIITVNYIEMEFFRCSYFIYNNYKNEDDKNIYKNILYNKPRIILKEIEWNKFDFFEIEFFDENCQNNLNKIKEELKNKREKALLKYDLIKKYKLKYINLLKSKDNNFNFFKK